jgi:hypothetical protein
MAIDRPNVFSAGAATNTDLFIDAATNKLGEVARVISFAGFNGDIDAAPEFITRSGTAITPTTGGLYDGINSTSASDDSAGIGVQQVLIEGLDENGDFASEFVTMNGLTITTFTNNYIWVNSVGVTRVGAATTNAGSLTLRDGVTGYQTGIVLDSGIPLLGGAAYPRGFQPLLKNLQIQVSQSAVTAGNVALKLYHAQGLDTTTPSVGVIREFNVSLGTLTAGAYNIFVETIRPPFIREGKAADGFTNQPSAGVFYLQADGDAAVDAVVSFQCDLLYRDARN